MGPYFVYLMSRSKKSASSIVSDTLSGKTRILVTHVHFLSQVDYIYVVTHGHLEHGTPTCVMSRFVKFPSSSPSSDHQKSKPRNRQRKTRTLWCICQGGRRGRDENGEDEEGSCRWCVDARVIRKLGKARLSCQSYSFVGPFPGRDHFVFLLVCRLFDFWLTRRYDLGWWQEKFVFHLIRTTGNLFISN